MKVRILTEADCRSVLTMADAIDLQAKAFELLYKGSSVGGLRSYATSDDPPGLALFNPCFLKGGQGYGVKCVSDFYQNDDRGVPRMTATMTLMDGGTGAPHTFMEAGYLTDLRTGAGTGVAAKYLARSDSRTLAVVGAGRVARYQVAALACVLPLHTVKITTRTRARGEHLVSVLRSEIDVDVQLVDSVEAAVAGADVVVAATTAKTPVVKGAMLAQGTFVVSAGSALPTTRELDTDTIRRAAACFIDGRADCLNDAGDYLIPAEEGVVDLADIADIGAVVVGEAEGRSGDDQILVYKSVGVPIQDLVTGQEIAKRCHGADIGVEMELNP